jgi:hypothetical protein
MRSLRVGFASGVPRPVCRWILWEGRAPRGECAQAQCTGVVVVLVSVTERDGMGVGAGSSQGETRDDPLSRARGVLLSVVVLWVSLPVSSTAPGRQRGLAGVGTDIVALYHSTTDSSVLHGVKLHAPAGLYYALVRRRRVNVT